MAGSEKSVRSGERRRNYPIRCLECGKKEVRPATLHHQVQRNHDGRLYDLTIDDLPVTKCNACGNVFFTEESDDRIVVALRELLALLTPEQVRANLKELGLSQKEAAERLGVAPETVSRWLCGSVIQSRAMDNLLRMFFASPEVRENLKGAERNHSFGETVRLPVAQGALRNQETSSCANRFPRLERNGQLRCSMELAEVIRRRNSVFAPVA